MNSIAISVVGDESGEYCRAVADAGGAPRLLRFDAATVDAQLDGATGVVLAGGGDVDPAEYGGDPALARGIDRQRDRFELALVRRARARSIPTLCICRGLQVANVAFGGTLVVDIATSFDAQTARRHRVRDGGMTERGLIPGHAVAIAPDTLLARIVARTPLDTGSRHHQTIGTLAADLHAVGSTVDGIVEAVEARFASPFWLGVQWHPESTRDADRGASRAIFAAFVAAANGFIPPER